MKKINTYIIEKLRINKETMVDNVSAANNLLLQIKEVGEGLFKDAGLDIDINILNTKYSLYDNNDNSWYEKYVNIDIHTKISEKEFDKLCGYLQKELRFKKINNIEIKRGHYYGKNNNDFWCNILIKDF